MQLIQKRVFSIGNEYDNGPKHTKSIGITDSSPMKGDGCDSKYLTETIPFLRRVDSN